MKRKIYWHLGSRLSLNVGIFGACLGFILGILSGVQPLILCIAISALIITICFLNYFEQMLLGLLVLRSSLDIFSDQNLPAIFAIGLDILIFLYIIVTISTGKKIEIDRFFLFLLGWVCIQFLWVIMQPLGLLGLDGSYLIDSFKEWTRLFSWVMIYFIVMQLKGKVPPLKIINIFFLSLIVPLSVAFLQCFLPSILPDFLLPGSFYSSEFIENTSRIRGTLGHPNTFTTFLVLFIGLTCWKLEHSERRWFWLLLLGTLVFFVTSTKTLVGLPMTAAIIFVFYLPRLTVSRFIFFVLLCITVVAIFAGSEFGRERLASLYQTPLLNPDISKYDAILMSRYIPNSFNWRITQWTSLLSSWRDSPILGFGLSTSPYVGYFENYAHNDYIRALVEGGVVGFIVFLIFLSGNLLRLISIYSSLNIISIQKNFCLVLIGMLIAMMLGMITENIFSHTTLCFYWLSLSSVVGWQWDET